MSMDLAVKTYRYDPHYFEAGIGPVAKAVKVAAVDIPAHAPVVLNSDGKLALIAATTTGEGDSAKTTVTTTGIYGVVPDSIRADEEGPVWLTGEYFADSLALPEGVTVVDVEVPLRNIGIFLK
ncbi:hypothetical protein D1159_00185 [Pseudoflavonifractor sp. 524-17]|uniref:hypothetical protein n=1 Tax=Pseudoflavonifractor sp. 524-17 TaxID=2304577 RepID=UPI00137B3004|nr:hypothetical protein [Pseudoflavonifractor sp. 524-17]NCE63030.1 hypothetical protein [Pseudoflavonifractor sp. 524-17]